MFKNIKTEEQIAAEHQLAARERWKSDRALAVSNITITTSAGNVFDGDENSQGRMARAILGLQAAPEGSTVNWVLHDNSVIDATIGELSEALMLSGSAQANLWVQPDE